MVYKLEINTPKMDSSQREYVSSVVVKYPPLPNIIFLGQIL